MQMLRGTIPHLTACSKALCKMPCILRTVPGARQTSSLSGHSMPLFASRYHRTRRSICTTLDPVEFDGASIALAEQGPEAHPDDLVF